MARLVILLFVLCLIAARSPAQDFRTTLDDSVLATVDSIQITVREFRTNYEQGPSFIKKIKNPKRGHLDLMINEKLLWMKGCEQGMQHRKEIRDGIRDLEEVMVIEQLLNDDVESKGSNLIPLRGTEIETMLKRARYQYKLKFLYAETRDEADELFAALKRGVPFDTLIAHVARTMEIAPTNFESDYLGWEDILDDALGNAVDSLTAWTKKPMQMVSDVVSLKEGCYVYTLVNRRDNPALAKEGEREVKRKIVLALDGRKVQRNIDEYIQTFMQQQNVVVKRSAFDALMTMLKLIPQAEPPAERFKPDTLLAVMDSTVLDDTLITSVDGNWTIKEFLEYYKPVRYKLHKENDFALFSSLKSAVRETVMDKSLAAEGYRRGLHNRNDVRRELSWWEQKWVSYELMQNNAAGGENIPKEWERLYNLLTELRRSHTIRINEEMLNAIRALRTKGKHVGGVKQSPGFVS